MTVSLRRARQAACVAGRLAALMVVAAPVAAHACQLVELARLPARFVHNQPLLEGEINGRRIWFLVDTGAAKTMLFGDGAQRLGLHATDAQGVEFHGVGGVRRGEQVFLKQLKLGKFTADNVTVFVTGAQSGFRAGDESAPIGLVGRDILTERDLEFDLAEGLIRLFRPTDCKQANLAYWSKEAMTVDMIDRGLKNDAIKLPVLLNGRRVEATLDSGAMTSIVTPRAAASAGVGPKLLDAGSKGVSTGIGARGIETMTATFDTLSVGDETVQRAKLRVADMFQYNRETSLGSHIATEVGGLPTMLLGADFLRSHRVLISNSQGRVYFSYNGGPIFQVVGPAAGPAPGAASSSQSH